jgi:PII-like signaling protein
VHEALVVRARELGLAGATVLRGVAGFGARSRLHTAKVLRLSENLPMVVEIVDREDRVRAFLEQCDAMITDGLVTLDPVEIAKYTATPPSPGA